MLALVVQVVEVPFIRGPFRRQQFQDVQFLPRRLQATGGKCGKSCCDLPQGLFKGFEILSRE